MEIFSTSQSPLAVVTVSILRIDICHESANNYIFFFILQSTELDSVTELFHLLEIDSGLWDRTFEDESKTTIKRRHSSDDHSSEEVGSSVSQNEEDEDCPPNRSRRRRSSSTPINLSVPNKIDSKSTSLSIDRNVSKVSLPTELAAC